jgi:hypothetical protein
MGDLFLAGKLSGSPVLGVPGRVEVYGHVASQGDLALVTVVNPGLNLYVPPENSGRDLRPALGRDRRVSRNLPAITETNKDQAQRPGISGVPADRRF